MTDYSQMLRGYSPDHADRVADQMRREGLDPLPARWPEVVAAMRSDTLPGGRGWTLTGPVGSGKTSRAAIASSFTGIPVVNASEIADVFVGAGVLSAGRMPGWSASCRCDLCDLIIDDLGAEPAAVRIWGEPRKPLAEVLEARLNLWPRIRTYVTTNLTSDEISLRYGERVASRLAGSMIDIALTCPDWRRAGAQRQGA